MVPLVVSVLVTGLKVSSIGQPYGETTNIMFPGLVTAYLVVGRNT